MALQAATPAFAEAMASFCDAFDYSFRSGINREFYGALRVHHLWVSCCTDRAGGFIYDDEIDIVFDSSHSPVAAVRFSCPCGRFGAHFVSKYKCRFISVGPKKYEILHDVVKTFGSFGKFVRLNLFGAIVEVVDCNSAEIVVNYKGEKLRVSHSEVSWATPEEAAAAAERISG